MPLKPAQYSTQLPYQTAANTTINGARYRVSYLENFRSRSKKSAERARAGTAWRDKSTSRGMKRRDFSDDEGTVLGFICTIKDGKNSIKVQ